MNTNGVVLRPVTEGDAVTVARDLLIGRDAECDLVLAGGAVSRKHARLSLQDGAPWLEDLGSANGTFVNDRRIAERVKLNDGDRLRFDIVEFDLIVLTPSSDATQVRASTVVRPAPATEITPPPPTPDAAQAPSAPQESPAAQASSAPQAPPAAHAPSVPQASPVPEATPAQQVPSAQAPSAPQEPPAPPPPQEAQPPAAAPERGAEKPAEAAAGARPAEAAPPPARDEQRPPAPPAKPEVQAAVANETRTKRAPGAWAFGDGESGGKTQLLGADELKQLLSQAAAPGQRTDINQPYLQVVSGKLSGKYLRLQGDRQTNVWTVGSDPARDIVLDDAGVSSFHAQLKNEAQRWKLVDQMSANGTYVNGTKATASFLSSGDRLRFGSVECIFHLPGARPAQAGSRRTTWLIAGASFVVTAALLFLLWGWLA